jgi:hypothetical protein
MKIHFHNSHDENIKSIDDRQKIGCLAEVAYILFICLPYNLSFCLINDQALLISRENEFSLGSS